MSNKPSFRLAEFRPGGVLAYLENVTYMQTPFGPYVTKLPSTKRKGTK